MWNRQILLLALFVVVVEPRPRALQDELPSPPLVPFNFGYEVNAEETGDTKSHQESLEDGILRGSYTVVQPDGFRRVVNYVSDAENGFRADVTFEKGYEHIIPKPTQHKSSGVSAESTASTSLSSAKTSSSSSENLEISDSLSTDNSESSQGLTSTGFSTPLVQVSDIKNYGNAQFAPPIDSTLSGQSSVQESALTSNEAATSSGSELTLDTSNHDSANEARADRFDHYYNTNTQVFCADCNGNGLNFESHNVISENNITPGNAVHTLTGNSENTAVDIAVEPTPVRSTIGDIFSRSFLVASGNLDSIDAVELTKAGFNAEQLYAYKLVPVQIVKDSTKV